VVTLSISDGHQVGVDRGHWGTSTGCPVCYPLPVELTDEEIQKFRDIWIQEFGEDIGMDQARIEAYNLMELAW
jgi:hypothetical protein